MQAKKKKKKTTSKRATKQHAPETGNVEERARQWEMEDLSQMFVPCAYPPKIPPLSLSPPRPMSFIFFFMAILAKKPVILSMMMRCCRYTARCVALPAKCPRNARFQFAEESRITKTSRSALCSPVRQSPLLDFPPSQLCAGVCLVGRTLLWSPRLLPSVTSLRVSRTTLTTTYLLSNRRSQTVCLGRRE